MIDRQKVCSGWTCVVVIWSSKLVRATHQPHKPSKPYDKIQQVRARMEDCGDARVPMTNYGLLLAFAASPRALLRAVRPYGVKVPSRLLREASASAGVEGSASAAPASCHEHLLPERGGLGVGSAAADGCSHRSCPLCLSASAEDEGQETGGAGAAK